MYLYLFKYIIVGDSNVGKSCILLNFIHNRFNYNHEVTIGVDFGCKLININNNDQVIPIKLQIWDTAGQENFKSIIRAYYRGAIGAILVYDITNRKSFDNIINWLNEVKDYNINNDISILLIGNKNDMEDYREVSTSEAIDLATEYNLLFTETSAKTSYNINESFNIITNDIYTKIKNNIIILNINSNYKSIDNDNICINRRTNNCC